MERSTRQRTAIRTVIDEAGRPLSSQEVLDGARLHVSALGLATVYRNLKLLLADGVIQLVNLPGENPRYESIHVEHRHHHHHFQCRTCDRVFDVHACPGSMEKIAPPGFVVEHHELTLYGSCAECSASVSAKPKRATPKVARKTPVAKKRASVKPAAQQS